LREFYSMSLRGAGISLFWVTDTNAPAASNASFGVSVVQ
jgi:hypothetical protein